MYTGRGCVPWPRKHYWRDPCKSDLPEAGGRPSEPRRQSRGVVLILSRCSGVRTSLYVSGVPIFAPETLTRRQSSRRVTVLAEVARLGHKSSVMSEALQLRQVRSPPVHGGFYSGMSLESYHVRSGWTFPVTRHTGLKEAKRRWTLFLANFSGKRCGCGPIWTDQDADAGVAGLCADSVNRLPRYWQALTQGLTVGMCRTWPDLVGKL